jgi:acetyl esterase/lipase
MTANRKTPNPSPRTRNPLVALIVGIGLAAGQLANTRQDSATSGPQTLVYGSDPVQAIDFYEPSPAPQSGTSPLIVFVHGGAWSMGSRENATGNAKIVHFTSKGIAFATIGYRLVPDFRVEDQASDVAHAIARLLADAERLHIDRRRVILMGHSAGAHLVALVGTDPRWLDATGLSLLRVAGRRRDRWRGLRCSRTIAFGGTAHAFTLSPGLWRRPGTPTGALAIASEHRPQCRQLAAAARRSSGRHPPDRSACRRTRRAGSSVDVVALPGQGLPGMSPATGAWAYPTIPARKPSTTG